jgi:Flp pilus assembly protein TadG
MYSEMAAMAAQGGRSDRADIAARRPTRRRGLLRRWLGCLVALRRAEDGVSAIEFALATPMFLAIILPVLDLGQAFSEQIRVNMAVQAGAQYASLNAWSSTSATDVVNIVKGATSIPFTGTNDSVSAVQRCGCPTSSGAPSLFAIPSAPSTCGSTTCSADSQPAGYYVQVIAQYAHTAVVPYSASPATLSSTAVVRIY